MSRLYVKKARQHAPYRNQLRPMPGICLRCGRWVSHRYKESECCRDCDDATFQAHHLMVCEGEHDSTPDREARIEAHAARVETEMARLGEG